MGKRWKAVILSMILPIIVQLGIYVVWGQFPFGDNSLLIWDMEWQYAPFFAHLHDILRRDASALYSFSRAIGGNMFSVAAYYLISPFNLLFYFFDAEHIYIGILIVTLLKVGASGMSMYCFLCRKKQCFDAILFSTAYALSAYMVGYQFNLLWLDALIFLPMVARGIEQIIDRGKFVLYTISISFAIITNFYMGYIICFFSVLYFLYYFFSITRRENILKIVTVYGISSVIGGGISAWIALPTWYVLQRGKNDISLSVLKDFHTIFSYTDLFDACFAGTVSTEQITDGRPLIYCGVLTLMMAMCWIVLGKESLRKRVLYLLLLGFIVLSFNYYNLNCLWHAFNYPVGSPYRFSFIYIFLLLDIAHKGYHSLLDQQTHNRTKALIGSGLILIIILIARRNTFVVRGQKDVLYSNIFLIVSYLWLLLFGRKKKVGMYLVTIVLCLELLFNADQLYSSSWQYDSVSVTGYNQYMEEIMPLVEKVKEDRAGARCVITQHEYRTGNDPFLFNLYGLDSYTSVEEEKTIWIGKRWGLSSSMLWGIYYENEIPEAIKALLGVKYIISCQDPQREYTTSEKSGRFTLYENENVLPFAVIANEQILEMQTNPVIFEYINEWYHSIDSQQSEDIFQKLHREVVNAHHCEITDDGSFIAVDSDAYVEYAYKADVDCAIYAWYEDANVLTATAYMEDVEIPFQEQTATMKYGGKIRRGDLFQLRFYLKNGERIDQDKIFVYGEVDGILDRYAMSIKKQQVDINMHTDSQLELSCVNKSTNIQYVLCSIPWENGWSVTVDGEKMTEPLEIQDFVAIPINYGEHMIELRYVPQGFYAGIVISMIALVFLLICWRISLCFKWFYQW